MPDLSKDELRSVAGASGQAEPSEPDGAGPGRKWKAGEAADYIGDLAGELAAIARDTKLDLLAYLLDMVRLEARRAARRAAPKNG